MMRRSVLASATLAVLTAVLAIHADDPRKGQTTAPTPQIGVGKDGQPTIDTGNLAKMEKELSEKFSSFQNSLLTLQQRLANSTDEKDKARATQLKKVLDYATERDISKLFTQYVKFLSEQKVTLSNTRDIQEAVRQSAALAKDLKEILDLLRSDNGAGNKKEERIALEKLLKELDKIIRDQKIVRDLIDTSKDPSAVGEDQKDVTQKTAELAKKMGKGGPSADPKDAKSTAKDPGKGNKGDGKGQGTQDAKAGDTPNGESKPGSDSKGEGSAKSGQPSPDSPQAAGGSKSDNDPSQSGQPSDNIAQTKKKIQEGNEYQRKTEENIAQKKKEDAGQNADEAIAKLEQAKKRLEDLIRQLREEELERVLAALINRCAKMLAMQEEVLRGTLTVKGQIENNPSRKADRDNVLASLNLSDDELKIVQEATKAIEILETEGTAVAFPEVFQQVREDMKHVQRRLKVTDAGDVTVAIEQDIIETLKEMIKALEKAQKDQKDSKAKQADGSPPPNQDQKLLDKLAELKMIKSMQLRVNARTELYGKQYTGEQAISDDILSELRDIAGRQDRIFEVTNRLAKGDNQ